MKKSPLLIAPIVAALAGAAGIQQGYLPATGSIVSSALTSPRRVKQSHGGGEFIVAQSDSAPKTQPSSAPTAGAASSKVDETALRYFARQGDKRRLEAEIARLRALYPDWTPPEDPTALAPPTDQALDAMWKLYAAGKLPELRRTIQERQVADPRWTPPVDLIDRLELAEARDQLVNASDLKQYDTVIRIGSSHNTLLTCSDVDVLWRVAEAFATTQRKARAKDAYGYVLDNCTKPEERLATVQKAMALLTRTDLDTLLAKEQATKDGGKEFDSIRLDLARKAVADAGADPKIVVAQDDVDRIEKLATDIVEPSAPLTLGWYYLRRNYIADAEKWFKLSHDRENSASSAQGLALAMIAQSRPAEAEAIVYEWRDRSDGTRAVYMAAVSNLLGQNPSVEIAPVVLQRMVPEVVTARDASAAQQLGWYAYVLNQFETASGWFSTALQWKPDDEPSSYGLVLTRQQLGDRTGVADIQKRWGGRSQRIAQLGELPNTYHSNVIPPSERFGAVVSETEPQQLLQSKDGSPSGLTLADQVAQTLARRRAQNISPNNKQEPEIAVQSAPEPRRKRPAVKSGMRGDAPALRGCTTTIDPQMLSPESALPRGWCLMELNRPLEAAAAFERALLVRSEAARSDAAYGQSLAYMRAGLADKAAVAASKARLKQSRQIELNIAFLSTRATEAFKAGRFNETLLALDQRGRIAPERNDLMILRGYAYLKLNRPSDAMRVFEAVAATGDKEGLRGISLLRTLARPE
jgi:tetratricopeptide (TPR) repeat protein